MASETTRLQLTPKTKDPFLALKEVHVSVSSISILLHVNL